MFAYVEYGVRLRVQRTEDSAGYARLSSKSKGHRNIQVEYVVQQEFA